MNDRTKIVAALLIGAAAGAVLGILLAPDSGEELRGNISDFFGEFKDSAKEKAQGKVNDLKDYGSNIYNTAKSKFGGAADTAGAYKDAAVDTATAHAKDIADKAKDYGNAVVDHAKSKLKSSSNGVNNTIQEA